MRPTTVDDYRAALSEPVRTRLDELLALIRDELPTATEVIAYGIPTFRLGGRSVVHCAGYAKHLSIHPIPEGDDDYRASIAQHVKGKGTLHFALDEPLPAGLVRATVRLLRAQAG